MLNDNLLLFKENLKSRLSQNFIAKRNHPAIGLAQKIANRVGANHIERIIDGKPNSYVIIADSRIIRVPLDSLTKTRYRKNMVMLKKLAKTKIADFVPRFLGEGNIDGCAYFCEKRLKGAAIDVPISKMDGMVVKAADFITTFHKETAQEIILDEQKYKKLFLRHFSCLSKHISKEYREKLSNIEGQIKNQVLGKPLVTVWQHGDYKIENILFNTSNWKIEGVIDWDLAEKEGLPFLDILYLLIYKANLITRAGIADIFKTRFLKSNFSRQEKTIINDYLKALGLDADCIKILLVAFWVHHLAVRYQSKIVNGESLDKEWYGKNVYSVLDLFSPAKKEK